MNAIIERILFCLMYLVFCLSLGASSIRYFATKGKPTDEKLSKFFEELKFPFSIYNNLGNTAERMKIIQNTKNANAPVEMGCRISACIFNVVLVRGVLERLIIAFATNQFF